MSQNFQHFKNSHRRVFALGQKPFIVPEISAPLYSRLPLSESPPAGLSQKMVENVGIFSGNDPGAFQLSELFHCCLWIGGVKGCGGTDPNHDSSPHPRFPARLWGGGRPLRRPPFVPLNGLSSDTVFHPQAVVVEALTEPEKVWTLIRITADAPGSTEV